MGRLALLLVCLGTAQAVVYVEAEALPYRGDWTLSSGEQNAHDDVLICTVEKNPRPAVGAITIPRAGTYRLMVRARDFAHDRPGTRRFAVEVGGRRDAKEFGTHANPDPGAHGWAWEQGGVFELPAGPVVVALVALTGWSRCDAIALVAEGEAVPRSVAAARQARSPLPPLEAAEAQAVGAPPAAEQLGPTLAVLQNQHVRLTFVACRAGGAETVAMRAEAHGAAGWREVIPATTEAYRVLQAPREVKLLNHGGASWHWPGWEPSRPLRVTAGLGAVRYETARGGPQWLPNSGELITLLPGRAVVPQGATVRLTATAPVGTVAATWRLEPNDRLPALSLRFTAAQAGSYGLGYGAGQATERGRVEEVLCPYLYQFRRLPTEPLLITTEATPTPLAVVQVGGSTRGVAFEPDMLDPGWPDARVIEAGFQLVDPDGHARPQAWGPVPGGRGALLEAGNQTELRLRLVAFDGPVMEAWRLVATDLYGLRDYRRNEEVSLTEATLNTIDLIKHPEASGWDERGLGFWNIEMPSTVTNAAPLAVVGAALLTGDEELWATRAVPSLAHLLSRPGTHFSVVPEITERSGSPALGRPTSLYGSTVRFGAAALTRGYAPRFAAVALDAAGQPVRTAGYGKQRLFEDAVAAWQATGDERYRTLAREDLKSYLDNYLARQTATISPIAFYQLTFTANWEGVLAASEALGDRELMTQAAALAARMLPGLFVYPRVVDGPMTVHPGGQFEGNATAWWFGPKLFARGLEVPPNDASKPLNLGPTSLPEAEVPGWQPSIVGLGIEQPSTYRRMRSPGAAIIMANWAPKLLRLGAATGEPLFPLAAHNAVLGRWANYPGYYVTGFTNATRSADYPYRGPDVSGLYVHHIPPFLGMLIDYLVSDVEARSAGAIRFPAERQMGYAWFDNRVFGHRPGTVYGTSGAWPWLRRGLVRTSTPRVNWLAAHTDDTVFVMLTNTSGEPLETTVRLDPSATGGAAGPVLARCENGSPGAVPLRDGAVTVPVAGQGLTVLEWRGCKVSVPFHREPAAPGGGAGYAEAVSPFGTVRATWLAAGPERGFLHIYSDHDGTRARRARITVTQGGQSRVVNRETWPLEAIVPVAGGQPVEVHLDPITAAGETVPGPLLKVAAP